MQLLLYQQIYLITKSLQRNDRGFNHVLGHKTFRFGR